MRYVFIEANVFTYRDYNKEVSERESQSPLEVTMQNIPAKRKLSEILEEIGQDDDLADRIEATSIEMRKSKMREAIL
jgi:predicted CopG family antitoxin